MERREFEQLARQVRPRILAMVGRLSPETAPSLGEDVAQDTLMRLWTLRDRLDSYGSPEALALTIARRRAIDLLRASARNVSLDQASDAALEVGSLQAAAEADERLDSIFQALDSLPSGQQMVMRLRHIDGLEIEEIARITSTSEGAVRTSLSRARQALRERLVASSCHPSTASSSRSI